MRRMGIGLGVGINRSNYAQGIFSAYQSRVVADGGVTEAGACVDAVSGLLQTASLLLIPSGYKGGKAYAEIPTNGNGDLTWTRASTALRTNSSGLLESMGSGVPRLSYMYGSCPALLLEPQRTNLVTYSQEFDNAAWTKINTTITANSTTSPDGTTNADTITDNSTNGSHFVRASAGWSTTQQTATVYAKAGTSSKVYIMNSSAGIGVFADLSTETIVVSSGFTGAISNVGNGWYRITATHTAPASQSLAIGLFTGTSTFSYAGSGSTAYIWGAQVELGAYPTTYIPTTSASATRIADSFSRSNIYTNGLITSSGGTWFVELRGNLGYVRDAGNTGIYIADDSSATNSFRFRTFGGGLRVSIVKSIATVESTLYTTTTDTVKFAIKWNGSTADVFVNGTKQVSGTVFTTTALQFLMGNANDAPRFIQAMALYPSPLSDTDCTTITTL